MRGKRKIWTEAEALADIPGLRGWTAEELDGFALAYANQGLVSPTVESRLRTPLATVWRCDGGAAGGEEPFWIVGGEVPFTNYDLEPCPTEFDALGIYAWFFSLWHRKMARNEEGDLPEYVVPPKMERLVYRSDDDVKLSRMRSFLSYRTVNPLLPQIENDEIRRRLRIIGVVGSKRLDE